MKDSERIAKGADFLTWTWAEPDQGFGGIGADLPERYDRLFDLSDPGAIPAAAALAVGLGLWAAVPILRQGGSIDDGDVLRAHTGAVRFPAGLEPADLLELEPRPDVVVWIDDAAPSFGLWGLVDPVSGPELAAIQARERDRLGGDPSWPARAYSLVPVPGASYIVNGRECEAIEFGGVPA